jgi:hypothetical protein
VQEGLGAGLAQPAAPLEGPRGVKERGWLVGEQLTEGDCSHVAAVVEKNRDVFAFGLEEIGQFKLFEVELKLNSEQPIFERRRKHSLREWELVDERCRELEAAGIIEECDSDFAANKKDPEGNSPRSRSAVTGAKGGLAGSCYRRMKPGQNGWWPMEVAVATGRSRGTAALRASCWRQFTLSGCGASTCTGRGSCWKAIINL